MTAPQQLHCAGCGRRLGRRAKALLLFGALVLCTGCAEDPRVHRELFGCRENHPTREHSGFVVSVGRARQALNTDP
jgi:hypothetical protein